MCIDDFAESVGGLFQNKIPQPPVCMTCSGKVLLSRLHRLVLWPTATGFGQHTSLLFEDTLCQMHLGALQNAS